MASRFDADRFHQLRDDHAERTPSVDIEARNCDAAGCSGLVDVVQADAHETPIEPTERYEIPYGRLDAVIVVWRP